MIGGLLGASPVQEFERFFQQGVELAGAGRDVEALVVLGPPRGSYRMTRPFTSTWG
jgi:hypothetical protein